ncbi:MAG: leucine--tRNA ligase [Candidatus Pacebacteria bacterium]|nr:leucine--tRNA ligase [Candidatus Paceibacterota bacterium]
MNMQDYNPKDIEKKWQDIWAQNGIYTTKDTTDKKNFYILDMFPYPSGEGLHVGHPRGYIATDVYSRFKRMHGFNVLHPMGWDAFGLPAENFAIKNKVHPREAVDRNVARFKEQLSLIGPDYDWSREIDTTDPNFYKWTQWMFLKMYEKGLAYQSHEPINWCPGCQTGLANEDLESDGTCERCGSVVEKKPMRQWVLKITDYADRLLVDLNTLPKWPEGVKEAQRNWIGKSEGSEIAFALNTGENVKVFTTRADTLFGATYIVFAPEHPLVQTLDIENRDEVNTYIAQVAEKTEIDRTAEGKEKTGVKLEGIVAINPANKEEIPVYIADYVLAHYGTGAVMAVPAHDERDFEFAKKYELPIKEVVSYYYEGAEDNAPKEDAETLHREVIDIIIENEKGEFLLIKETANNTEKIHFVGGGTEGENEIEALEKELREETGYTDFEIIEKIPNLVSAFAFRHTKLKNQKIHGYFFHIKLKSENRVASEVEEGRHSLLWAPKEKIKDLINWPHHAYAWEMFLKKDRVFTDFGILINSGEFNGLTSEEAKQKITEFVGGEMKSTYRLKDWVFSRQRYWGEPIPMVFDADGNVYPVDASELPILLPNVDSYEPTGTGESPLATIDDWVNVRGKITDQGTFVQDASGQMFRRETNTMPQWAGSSWYYLRYVDPKNNQYAIDSTKEKDWLPVDVYVGGDHATRHLIYARFWHKFLYDIDVVSGLEPFPRLEFLGFILAEDGRKMSKRWKNVINPDDMVNRFGADAFRLYEMFIGPFENTVPWNTDGVVGTRRFLEKVWKQKEKIKDEENQNLEMILHKTIKKISDDIEAFKFNTAVSHMMILVNEITKEEYIGKNQYASLLQILAPFAPHITEEIWYTVFGEKDSIHLSVWPEYDASKIIESTIKIVVQVNGKVRGTIEVPIGTSEDEIKKRAVSETKVEQYFTSEPEKVLYIPNRAVNFIIKN